jgi:hypothetical protein
MKYSVPTSQRTVFSLTMTSLVMLYRKVIAVYLEVLRKLFSLLKEVLCRIRYLGVRRP